jgi:tight adherence protein C
MPLFVIVAALAVSVSVPILWWSLASDRSRPSAVELQSDTVGQVTDTHQLMLEEGAGARVMRPAVKSVGAALLKLTPVGWIASLRRNLMLGGHPGDTYALERTLVLKVLMGIVGFLLGYALLTDLASAQRLVVSLLMAALGFFLPDIFVSRRGRKRQEQIQLEMPDTLDQLTMSVEAGLGFEAALTRAARAGDGPFAQEIHRTLREIQLGISRPQALQNLADRTDVPDLDSFVLAVVQSEKYGIGIGQVLRVQSDELREKRRQRAEERALKIPVKIIFPLAFCIFPAIFIILLGPVGIRIFTTLGSL